MTPSRRISLLVLSLALGLTMAAPAAHALKVVTWNIIFYPTTNLAARQPNLRTSVAAMDPDVIIVQEFFSAAGRDSFLNNVLNVVHPGQWSASGWYMEAEGAIFYKTAKAQLIGLPTEISTGGPRTVLQARMRFPGFTSRFAEFRIYSVHFKAGQASADSTERRQECTSLRTTINTLNLNIVTPNAMLGGDTNFYGSWEGGYIRLTEQQADNDGRFFDPIFLSGTWNSSAYRLHHTQSTCNSTCPSGAWSGGGLDDRFDLWLFSASMRDGEGVDLVADGADADTLPDGYDVYGNDGAHYNNDVNGDGFNLDVGYPVATALMNSSDHLPVIAVIQAPARVIAASQLDFGRVIIGSTPSATLNVSNGSAAPADELTYSLTAPSGFTAPGGTFTANSGAPANAHAIGMSTASTGAKSGVLTVANDDPDSTAKPVQLSGTVVAHAAPSLDGGAVVTSETVTFSHSPSGFADEGVCVHNVGWNALQAKYLLNSGVVAGGDGRFSIVGGFTPAEIAGDPACFTVRFDDMGATADSMYEATLTFSGADEALPGAAPGADLVVTLRATLTSSTTGTPGAVPERIAFLEPRPNPFRGAVDLAFELPRPTDVALELIDLSGRRVTRLLEGERGAGRHTVRWSRSDDAGRPIEAGLYFVRFRAGGFTATRRLVLLP